MMSNRFKIVVVKFDEDGRPCGATPMRFGSPDAVRSYCESTNNIDLKKGDTYTIEDTETGKSYDNSLEEFRVDFRSQLVSNS